MPTTTYTVLGMTFGHCVSAVTQEVQQIDDVDDVKVDLATGALTVNSSGEIDRATVVAAVDEAGYELAPV